ncbi:MAG: hypothetical protein IKN72_00890, partial [Clostridia bacterium]|nr:hypothetical protein [Clostridia bacterium]
PQFRTAKKQLLQIAETALNCSSLSLGELLQRLENSPVDCFSRWPQRLCREDPQFRTAKKQPRPNRQG